jgi:hypothetical protein
MENPTTEPVNRAVYTDNEWDIPALSLEMQAWNVDYPINAWRTGSKTSKRARTHHFYQADSHFTSLKKRPGLLLQTEAPTVVEPNYSLDPTTPRALGMEAIYRKRELAQYWGEHGRKIWVDMHVPAKYRKLNLLGIPAGWNAYMTRGSVPRLLDIDDVLQALDAELALAREFSGLDHPRFAVYAGPIETRDWCRDNRAIYIPNNRPDSH